MEGHEESNRLFADLSSTGVSISAISYMEIVQGLLQASGGALEEFHRFLRDVPVLAVDQDVAYRCATLRLTLTSQGKRVRQRALDLLIAATAIEHNLTLVTRNLADYPNVPGLILYRTAG
jgi:predicted nucleic acid-binding protein